VICPVCDNWHEDEGRPCPECRKLAARVLAVELSHQLDCEGVRRLWAAMIRDTGGEG
jgi:hypothetical protein